MSTTTRQRDRHNHPAGDSPFAPFVDQQTVLLTTYRRDGTPVSSAVDGNRAYFRTWETAP